MDYKCHKKYREKHKLHKKHDGKVSDK